MTPTLLSIILAVFGALVEVQSIPWNHSESTAIVADFDLDGRGEVGIITRNRLDVYERDRGEPVYSVGVPDGTSIVDVFDVNSDGIADIVAVSQDNIVYIPMVSDPSLTAPIICFSRSNQYSHYAERPFPGVLVILREETPLIALPCAEALELRDFSGNLVDSFPIGMDAPRRVALGLPFSAWTNQHAQLGSPDSLEFRVNSVTTYKPKLPDDALPLAIAKRNGRLGTPRQEREAMELLPERWPWFPIKNSEGHRIRALYARSQSPVGKTAIRIRNTPGDAIRSDAKLESIGPARYYPGYLLRHPERLPDFDGDGFHDLLLWKSRRVSPSMDNLARAAVRGTWPILVIAHGYAPKKKRFEAKALGTIALEIPLAEYVDSRASSPIGTIFLHDVDGDARTDFGCLTDSKTVGIWQSLPHGFSDTPGFRHEFSEPIERVEFEIDLDGQGLTTIALRSRNRLHLLRPDTTFARKRFSTIKVK